MGRSDLDGVKVAVQGLGHVGMYLCEELAARGARLVVADINLGRVAEAQARFGAAVAHVDDILMQDVDVVAPCALGGAITEDVAAHLSARIVAGAANNQLLTPEAGRILARRGVLYAPDYVINAGGIIMVSGEISGNNEESVVLAAVDRIGGRLDDIFARAQKGEAMTFEIADQMAQGKIQAARKRKAA
jgi:leucine dehydrogenase